MSSKQYRAIGEEVSKRVDKVNAELIVLLYGSIVAQLVKDYDDYTEVNKQLDKMGYNIGLRLIEDFLARANTGRCQTFRDTAEVISKVSHSPTQCLVVVVVVVVSQWLRLSRLGSRCF